MIDYKWDMVKCSIYSSKAEVFRVLQSFLVERNYKNIVIDKEKSIINAQRKDSVFKSKYDARFIVKSQSETVTEIEITVNPQHQPATMDDIKKEEKIRSRIYFYF